jgi:hypothetical protein
MTATELLGVEESDRLLMAPKLRAKSPMMAESASGGELFRIRAISSRIGWLEAAIAHEQHPEEQDGTPPRLLHSYRRRAIIKPCHENTNQGGTKNDRELIAIAKTHTLEEIAEQLQRPEAAILKAAARLGLSVRGVRRRANSK